jgi:hypothetical protein
MKRIRYAFGMAGVLVGLVTALTATAPVSAATPSYWRLVEHCPEDDGCWVVRCLDCNPNVLCEACEYEFPCNGSGCD